ncbi:type II secretion system protein [Photobacterium leiognathi]|uniref:type II secretion system protein n=1 Tax=Photobacterium leiognathi TaxID=553611 RepID=UPI00273A55EC|nr:type II secretion system protein [Photobacterium leiognathi]
MKNKLGFTLIELVVVIVILGILAVVAVPKFMQIQSDARKADLHQLAGTLQSTAATVNAKAMVEGKETALNGTVDGISIANGYPTATEKGIVSALSSPESWYRYPIDMKKLALGDHFWSDWAGSKLQLNMGMMVFSLKDLSGLTQKQILASHCYVIYTDLAAGAEKSAPDNGSADSHDDAKGGWRHKLYQLHKRIWQKGICPYVLKPVKLDSYFTICHSEDNHKEADTPDNMNLINAPTITVVDDKC